MSGQIPLRCWCGGEIRLDPDGKPRRCGKCRTVAMALETKIEAVFFVRSEGEWVRTEIFCDGCGRPLLQEQVVQRFEDVQFCEKCKWSDEQLAKLRAEQTAAEAEGSEEAH